MRLVYGLGLLCGTCGDVPARFVCVCVPRAWALLTAPPHRPPTPLPAVDNKTKLQKTTQHLQLVSYYET